MDCRTFQSNIRSKRFFMVTTESVKMDIELKSLVQQITLSSDIFESNSPLEVSLTIKIRGQRGVFGEILSFCKIEDYKKLRN